MGNTSSKEFELLSMGMLCFYSAGSSEQYISISSSGRFLHLSSDEGSIQFKSFKLNKDFRVQDEIPDKNSFIISYGSDKKTFVLRMENTEQFQTWKNYFKSLSRPSWDEKGSQFCKVCAKEFNLFRRQHHCRKCGKVICRKHGNKKIWLRELGYNSKQRVCIACFN